MQDFEKLGAFYLGREYDIDHRQTKDDLVMYDAKDLTTHAVCVGMTGSGKTGLCLALLEEAAIDGIPAIIVDPKGDLGNLLLAFPELQPENFRPWIDPAEATRKGQSVEDYAKDVAQRWKAGLAEWGQDPARIQRFKDAADIAIYTPGGTAGLPLTVLRSFQAPPAAILNDADLLRERINAAAAGLLALLGIDADPLQSREQILLATIFDVAWRAGEDLDLGTLIRQIGQPPFAKVGFMDLEGFFPAKDRTALAMKLNNLLASPGFSVWMQGEPLDIQRLLYTPEGKPRLAILSIAHLSDAERQFFVTILLNEVISWMRAQSGTTSLRALFYMDEVFGYFPPTANPPTKAPMLTLLKQARAFGLGVMLCTQNPVDLDYKGLSNAGTWFLGRLQTERDKARVLDGLEGASAAAGAHFDRSRMEKILSALGNRIFLMNNVHEDQPIVFQTRWALSYLRGPLNRDDISRLMKDRKAEQLASGSVQQHTLLDATGGSRPIIPAGVNELFVARRLPATGKSQLTYRGGLLGVARIHFAQASAGIDEFQDVQVLVPAVSEVSPSTWETGVVDQTSGYELDDQAEADVRFAPAPPELLREKTLKDLTTQLKDYLFRTQRLTIYKCPALKETSKPGETAGDFRARIAHAAKEERDLQIEKLRTKYAPKLATLQEQIRKAYQRVEKEKAQASQQQLATVVSVGASVVGALFGRKLTSATNINKAASTIKQAGKVMGQNQDVAIAGENVDALQARLAELQSQFEGEAGRIQATCSPDSLELEETTIAPKKTDINVLKVSLAWTPWLVEPSGQATAAY